MLYSTGRTVTPKKRSPFPAENRYKLLTHIVARERIWWHTSGAKRCKKIFVVPLHFFGCRLQVQLVALVSAFVMVSTVWSVSCLLSFYSRCPSPVPSHLLPPCRIKLAPQHTHTRTGKAFTVTTTTIPTRIRRSEYAPPDRSL